MSSGHGRRRRAISEASPARNMSSTELIADNHSTPFTRFKENLEYTVVMPGELFHRTPLEATCATSMMIAVALGTLLFMSALLVSYLLVHYQFTALHDILLAKSLLHESLGHSPHRFGD